MAPSRRAFSLRSGGLALVALCAWACQPAKPAPNAGAGAASEASPSPSSGRTQPSERQMSPSPSTVPDAASISAEETGPIAEGLTAWRGMVVPTKGGFQVRGVTVEHAAFTRLLAASVHDGIPSDPDWYLGAVVRVRGVVERHLDEASPEEAKLHVQRRAGSWLGATRLETVELVKPAEQVEGVLRRSKGFFQVDKVLVAPRDIDWAAAAAHEGDKIRLWGQLHVQVCDPRAQCLLGGSLPLFEVGRAKKID